MTYCALSPNLRFELTAAGGRRALAVPSLLRSSAAAQPARWVS
jgi:hypothetical protein